jgi:hypothetical protein
MMPPAAIVSRYHVLDSLKDIPLRSLAKIPLVLVATLAVLLPL